MYRSAHTVLLALMLLSGVVVRSATLSEVQSQVFDASCTGCHSGSSPSQGLNLSEGAAYGNTVNVPSTEVHITNPAARGGASVVLPACKRSVYGFGIYGYYLAIQGAVEMTEG